MENFQQGDFRISSQPTATPWERRFQQPRSGLSDARMPLRDLTTAIVAAGNLDSLQLPSPPSIYPRTDYFKSIIKTEAKEMGVSNSLLQPPLGLRQPPPPPIYQAPVHKADVNANATTYSKYSSYNQTPQYQPSAYRTENTTNVGTYPSYPTFTPFLKEQVCAPSDFEELLMKGINSKQPYRFFVSWREGFVPFERDMSTREGRRRKLAEQATFVGTIAYTTCKACEEGRGLFTECIVLGKIFDGRCCCCLYEGKRCTLGRSSFIDAWFHFGNTNGTAAWPESDEDTGTFL